MTPRGVRRWPTPDAEAGFTLIEMVVGLNLMAGVLLSMAFVLFGAMNGLVTTRQRSVWKRPTPRWSGCGP